MRQTRLVGKFIIKLISLYRINDEMKFWITVILLILTILPCSGIPGDTLSCDTVLNTPAIGVMFKGGTNVVLNHKGEVVEGVLAVDTDLWTTGPLVLFQGGTRIMINEAGKVYEGFPAVNFIGEASNGKFYEFKAMTVTFFDKQGRVSAGSAAQGIEYICKDGTVILSDPGAEIRFYSSGNIRQITPVETVKLSINTNEKISFMAHRPIVFDSDGYVMQGISAKKATFVDQNGNTVTKHPGDIIKFNSDGMLIN